MVFLRLGIKELLIVNPKEFLMNYCGLRLEKKEIMELHILNEFKYLNKELKI